MPLIRRLPQSGLECERQALAFQLGHVGIARQAVDRQRLRGERLQRCDVAGRLGDQHSVLVVDRRAQPARSADGAIDDALHRGLVATRGEDVVADECTARHQQQLVVLAQFVLDELVEHAAEGEDDEDGEQGNREADLHRHRAPHRGECAAHDERRHGHCAWASNT